MVIGFFCRTTPLLSFCNDRAVPNRHASSRAGKPGEQMNQVERGRERGREGEPSNFLAWFLLFLTASNSSDDLDCLAAAAAERQPLERGRDAHTELKFALCIPQLLQNVVA